MGSLHILSSSHSAAVLLNNRVSPVDHLISIRCSGGEERGLMECRICQEEEEEVSNLDAPCACSGSVKYAHSKCLQRWCNEKGNTICEICHQPYKSGYTALRRPTLNLRNTNEWDVSREAGGSAVFTMDAESEEYDDHSLISSTAAACCRCAALVLLTLLLLRHALAMAAAPVEEDSSIFFILFLLRAAGFFLPCYIMARAMNILARRRQQQEEEEDLMASEEVGVIVEAGLATGLRLPQPLSAQAFIWDERA